VVTILFSDLAGFTSRSETLDPEDARALLVPYYAILEDEVTGHGGVVERHIGDGIMALFGAPTAHEDDPERAIRAALRILERIPALGTDLHARIGINTGEILYRSEGQGREDAVTGDAANTAARLQGLAPVDGVVVGESTWRATSRVFEYVEHPEATVKGKAIPIRVFQPTAPRARFGVDLTRTHDTPYVGRQAELAAITTAFDAAVRDRRSRLVLIVGQPGMGKSRLLAELGRDIERRPDLVTWRQGRCLAYGDGITFWALGEIVKAHAGILETDDPATASGKIRAVLPEMSDRDWLHQRLLPLVGVAAASSAERAELFAAWTAFIVSIARTGPAILVVEDLHWADPALLAFIEHLVSRAVDVPLLLVGTARPELFERSPGFGEGPGGTGRIDLKPLDDTAAGELVGALVGSVVPDDLRARILDRAGGNPLYVEEFIRLLRDRDLLEVDGGTTRLRSGAALPLPESISALLAARMDMLNPEQRALLGDASVLGKVFWTGGVAAMAELDVTAVSAAMVELAERELVRAAPQSSMAGEDEYAFWHVLARDVAYGQLPRAVRAALHVSAANWLEARFGERADDVAELLAHHWSTALEFARAAGQEDRAAELEPKALRYLLRAGEKALGLDTTAALTNLERALALAPPGRSVRPLVLVRFAEAAQNASQYAEAAAALEEAIAAFEAAGDAPATARAMRQLTRVYGTLGNPRRWTLAREALELLEPLGESPDLIAALTEVASLDALLGRNADAIATADRALDLAVRLGVPRPARALGFRGIARGNLGDPGAAEDLREGISLATAIGDGREVGVLHNNLGVQLWRTVGPVAALETIGEGIRFARDRGLSESIDILNTGLLESLHAAGRHDQALVLAGEVIARASASNNVSDEVYARGVQVRLLVLRGDTSKLRPMVEVLESRGHQAEDPGLVLSALAPAAFGRFALGQVAAAESLLAELGAQVEIRQNTLYLYPDVLPEMVRTALAIERPKLAAMLVAGIVATYPLAEHALAGAHAAIAEFQGDLDAALTGYGDTARQWEQFGFMAETAFATLGRGRCLVRLGRHSEARAALARARELFEALHAAPALAEVDKVLGRVGNGTGP